MKGEVPELDDDVFEGLYNMYVWTFSLFSASYLGFF